MLPIIATDLQDVYLTGDTHFDHGNMIKFMHRPFLSLADQAELVKHGGRWHDGSWTAPRGVKYKISREGVEAMNDQLIDLINDTVPRTAKLIHVGDFAINPKNEDAYANYIDRCAAFRRRINCEWVAILWGNHDLPNEIADLFQWHGFKAQVQLTKLNTYMIIDHYCNAVWDKSHRGSFHVYGHSHSEIEPFIEQAMPGRRSMDVGIDNAAKILGQYRPFRLQEVLDLLTPKPGFNFNPAAPTNYQGPNEHG